MPREAIFSGGSRPAVSAGVDWVQIRERELEGRELLVHAEAIANAARRAADECDARVTILVNRRTDIALTLGAEGVHLGFDAVDLSSARALLGPKALIGLSAHSPAEIPDEQHGASYAHLAPIFPPLSKPASRPALGADALTRVEFGTPVLAQGGVTAENASALIRAGAAGVAVTAAILSARNPAAATSALRAALDRAAP